MDSASKQEKANERRGIMSLLNRTIRIRTGLIIVIIACVVVGVVVFQHQQSRMNNQTELLSDEVRSVEVRLNQMKQFRLKELEDERNRLQAKLERIEAEHDKLAEEKRVLQTEVSELKSQMDEEVEEIVEVFIPEEEILPEEEPPRAE